VKPETVSRLLDLNRLFYHSFAAEFSATRQRIQPGVRSVLPHLGLDGVWLDLGCGNGELARVLAGLGFTGSYTGLDFSAELIAIAAGGAPPGCRFMLGDLSSPHWADPFARQSLDVILAFAALHHLPGLELRVHVLRQARLLLKEGGRLVHSEWQFQHSPKLVARIQPWERIGLVPADVEEGDTLLDWRAGPAGQPGLRYVHCFNPAELADLAENCGFEVLESFESDGHGGRLGLYQVWQAA
jgi:tRNA (uracil-5-)-methyltransferase TRM9